MESNCRHKFFFLKIFLKMRAETWATTEWTDRVSRKYLLNSKKQTNKQIIKLRENKQPIEKNSK